MQSGLPPTIAADTGTPSDEWAHNTTTAALNRPSFTPVDTLGRPATVESADSTPGAEFPGAFPKQDLPRTSESGAIRDGPDFGAAAGRAAQTVSDAAQTVSNTAAEYLPKVVGTVSSYIPGAGTGNGVDRAAEYDVPPSTTFPVQSAPKLDERDISSTSVQGLNAPPTPQHPLAAASYPAAPYEAFTLNQAPAPAASDASAVLAAPEPHTGATGVTSRTSKPSFEVVGAEANEHSDGIGALPGRGSEASVAKLPDEKLDDVYPTRETGGNEPFQTVGGVGALPGGPSESGVAVLPDEQESQNASNRTGISGKAERAKEGVKETAKKATGTGQGDQKDDVTDSHEETGTQEAAQEQQSGAQRDSHSEKTKKAGFMTKMKGEAKILLGKVEGKSGREKVEEGKRMKAGEA